jgi:hypothetical protein
MTVFTKIAGDSTTAPASTAFVGTAISNVVDGQTWTGTHNFTGATINAFTQVSTDNSTKVATTAFVKANSGISGILTGNNTYTGNNIFDLGLKFGGSTGTTQILITSDTIKSSLSNDTVNLFNTNTSGQINMASNLIFKASNILSSGAGDTINLFNTNTTGQINMASNLVFKASNILSSGASNAINLFNNLTSGTLNIGVAGSITSIYGKLNIGTTRQFGYTSYVIHDGSTGNYTITNANINIDFYIVVIGTVNCSVLLNAVIPGQRVYIRNAMGSTKINNVISSTSNILLAGGGISNIYTMTENTGSMLLCDGGSWIVMLKY